MYLVIGEFGFSRLVQGRIVLKFCVARMILGFAALSKSTNIVVAQSMKTLRATCRDEPVQVPSAKGCDSLCTIFNPRAFPSQRVREHNADVRRGLWLTITASYNTSRNHALSVASTPGSRVETLPCAKGPRIYKSLLPERASPARDQSKASISILSLLVGIHGRHCLTDILDSWASSEQSNAPLGPHDSRTEGSIGGGKRRDSQS